MVPGSGLLFVGITLAEASGWHPIWLLCLPQQNQGVIVCWGVLVSSTTAADDREEGCDAGLVLLRGPATWGTCVGLLRAHADQSEIYGEAGNYRFESTWSFNRGNLWRGDLGMHKPGTKRLASSTKRFGRSGSGYA